MITARLVMKDDPDLGILTEDALTLPLGIGFNKNNPVLREKFNSFLETAKSSGIFDEMYRRWFETDIENLEVPQLDMPSDGEEFVAGIAVVDLPYVGYVNGKYTGFDVELLERFAIHEGMRLRLMPMDFNALVPALASGKVDAITAGICITEERQKAIDFSDPYLDFKTAALALKENIATPDGGQTTGTKASFWQRTAESFKRNLIVEDRYQLIVSGLEVTVIISILSTIAGTILGALVCLLRMSSNKGLKQLARVYISIIRGIPVLVLLMMIFYVVFASVDISPILVAVIAFGMNFAAYVSEMFRTGIESVDKGQIEAGIAMGFSKGQAFFHIVLPQALRKILPVYKGEFISLVKMTSVVGYIAVQDLTKASDIIRSRTYEAFFPLIMVAVLHFAISWLLALSLGYPEIRTDPKARRKQVLER